MARTLYHMLLAAASLGAGAAQAAPSVHPTHIFAFEHVSVVPMDRERVLADQTVVVTNGRITEIGDARTVKVPKGATRIRAAGRYLMPALSDMHVHIEGESWNKLFSPATRRLSKDAPFEDLLFPYVANGVTTVQVLSGTHELLPVRARIAEGSLLAPRLILARMIDGPGKAWPPPLADWVATPEEAREATRRAKADGYDKMKVYSFLTKDTYDAVIATAREQHMDVVGHVPNALSVEYVVDAGQKMIAHTEEVAKQADGDYSASKIDYYARRIADGHVWMTPTLITTRRIIENFRDPKTLFSSPEAKYFAHPMQKEIWTFIAGMNQQIPPDLQTKLSADFERFQRPLTKVFHDHGGQLMTGTDSLFPRLVPGFALHDELRELVAVGLTPFEALRASTTIPYEYLGEAEQAGTIAKGKTTDLLLVEANPLADVTAASRIAGVLMRGQWIDKSEIDRRMARLARGTGHAHSGGKHR